MLTRAACGNNARMPELPDLDILADAFTAALAGRALVAHDLREPLVLRGTAGELAAFHGQPLAGVDQRGKFLTLRFPVGRIVVNAMLTGRLGLSAPGARDARRTALSLRFGARSGASADQPRWTRGAAWLPVDAADVELRYRDATRMGKVYVLPNGVDRPVAGWDELGPDADDPTLDLETWMRRIARHRGELKGLLKDQSVVAGIGNAYSDEILWQARLAPFRRRQTLADEEAGRLWEALREVPGWAIGVLRERVPPRFDVEVRDFLLAHGRGGQPCSRCGAALSEVSPGGFVTSWCRACQR
jgi:formamidopyrimidine-DNA glycosylase